MITEGGPHPPEKWAEQTADQIISVAESAPDALLAEARSFHRAIIDILTKHHASVQRIEREHLRSKGAGHYASPIDPLPHIENPVTQIIDTAKGTSLESHFAQPFIKTYLMQVIGNHFHDVVMIERSYHRDIAEGSK